MIFRENLENGIKSLIAGICSLMNDTILQSDGHAKSFLRAKEIATQGKLHICRLLFASTGKRDLFKYFEMDYDDAVHERLEQWLILYFWESPSLQREFRLGEIAKKKRIVIWESEEEEFLHSKMAEAQDSEGGFFPIKNQSYEGPFKERKLRRDSNIGILISLFGWQPYMDIDPDYDRIMDIDFYYKTTKAISVKAWEHTIREAPEKIEYINFD